MATPESVILAGAALIMARTTAETLEKEVDAAILAIEAAAGELVKSHGLKHMQAGEAYAILREVQGTKGRIMMAHNSVRAAITAAGIPEPTDEEIVKAIGNNRAASIR